MGGRPTRAALVLAALAASAPASAHAIGTDPIPISVGPGGVPANGPSGGPAYSGDSRKGRLAAFHSEASNLVGGDTNGESDVFVWRRPRGSSGLTFPRPVGTLQRVSVGPRGQANGPSLAPSLDGATFPERAPHCVAFQSRATNLAPTDLDGGWDVFVRDLRRRVTIHVSRRVRGEATEPAIDGSCRQVAFSAGGAVYLARVRDGRARSLGRGGNPDVSLDGTAVVWERGRSVLIRRGGRTSVVGPGSNPRVSDREGRLWGVAFETTSRLVGRDSGSGSDVYTRVFGARGRPRRTDLVSATGRGGGRLPGTSVAPDITAFGTNRGFITWITTVGPGQGPRAGGTSTLYYRNNNSGGIDDLARTPAEGDQPSIIEAVTSARGNFVAFSSTAAFSPFDGNGSTQDVFVKHLGQGTRL